MSVQGLGEEVYMGILLALLETEIARESKVLVRKTVQGLLSLIILYIQDIAYRYITVPDIIRNRRGRS